MNYKVGITGAAAGIGKGIASQFVKKGYSVVLIDRNFEKLDTLRNELLALYPYAIIQLVKVDFTDKNSYTLLFEAVPELDVLVNNIGYYENIPFFEIQDIQWNQMIELNFMIGMRLSKYYLQKMLYQNYGRIIFISSESALNPDIEKIHYCVCKTMVSSLARNLAELTRNTNVTVNAVLPGPVLTEGTERFIKERYSPDLEEAQRLFMASRPTSIINRLITPEEIGHAVTFLADKDSGAINGSNMRVDGGIISTVF